MDENELDRMDHKDALASALQSVAEAAAWLCEYGSYQESDSWVFVLLGRFQDLTSALDAARALGWQTTDEAQDALDLMYGKGTGFR